MFVRSGDAIPFPIAPVPVHSLDGPILVVGYALTADTQHHAVRELVHQGPTAGGTNVDRAICRESCVGKVFGDLDFYIAEITLSRKAFSLLFGWIIRLGGTRRPSFHPTIPVVRDWLSEISYCFIGHNDLVGKQWFKPFTCILPLPKTPVLNIDQAEGRRYNEKVVNRGLR